MPDVAETGGGKVKRSEWPYWIGEAIKNAYSDTPIGEALAEIKDALSAPPKSGENVVGILKCALGSIVDGTPERTDALICQAIDAIRDGALAKSACQHRELLETAAAVFRRGISVCARAARRKPNCDNCTQCERAASAAARIEAVIAQPCPDASEDCEVCDEAGCVGTYGPGKDHLGEWCDPCLRKRYGTPEPKRLTCSFCGHDEPRSDDVEQVRNAMASHIVDCEKHPMRAAVDECVRLHEVLENVAKIANAGFADCGHCHKLAGMLDPLRAAVAHEPAPVLVEETKREGVADLASHVLCATKIIDRAIFETSRLAGICADLGWVRRWLATLKAAPVSPFDKRDADILADEVAVLIKRGVIDSRSICGDALLDYRNPPSSERSDRLFRERGHAAPAPAQDRHRELLRTVLDTIHMRHCCEPFDSRVHRADVYTNDCCALCKNIRAAIAQQCVAPDDEWDLIHECVPYKSCEGVVLAIPGQVEGDAIRVLRRRRAKDSAK